MTINIDNTKALERIAGALENIDYSLQRLCQIGIDNTALEIAKISADRVAADIVQQGVSLINSKQDKKGDEDAE